MDHHPLQRELAIKAAAADVSEKRLDELRKREREIKDAVHELGNAAGTARASLREAAGARAAGDGDEVAFQKARKAVKAAEGEHDLATIELEGIAARVQKAESEHKSKRRDLCLAGVDVCVAAANIEEGRAWLALEMFCRLMNKRHALAYLAGRLGSEAAGPGRSVEPIRYQDPMAGMLADAARPEGLAGLLAEHGLTSTFAPVGAQIEQMDVADLLELSLPSTTEAAE